MSKSRKRGTALAAALLTLVGLLALAGCGGSSSGTTGGESTAGATTEGEASGGSAKEVSVAMVETLSANPFFESAKEGAEAAAADDGHIDLTVQAPSVSNGTNEATMAANLLAEEPEGFAPDPCVLPAWTRVLKEMTEQVPNNNVVAWNCPQIAEPGQTSPVKTFVGVNNKESGRVLAETLIEAGGFEEGTTGAILLANCHKGVPILDERVTGAAEVFKEKLPKATIVEFASAEGQSANNAAWTSELSKESNAIIASGPCDEDSASLLNLASKSPSDLAIGSYDPNEAELKGLSSGVLTAAVSTQPWTVAYVAVALAAEGARGTAAPEGWINIGNTPITEENASGFEKASSGGEAKAEFFRPFAQKAIKEAGTGQNVQPLDAVYE